MASFAEMIYGTAQNVAQNQGQGITENFAKGADLAIRQEQLVQARQDLEQKKVSAAIQQNKDILDAIELGEKTKDPAMQKMIFEHVVPAKVKGYGQESTWSPEVLEALKKSPEARSKITGLRLHLEDAVATGKMNLDEALSELGKNTSDPVAFVQSDYEKLAEARKFRLANQNQLDAAGIRAAGQVKSQEGINSRLDLARGDKMTDKIVTLGLPSLKTAFKGLDTAIPGGIDGWKKGMKVPGISDGQAMAPANRLTGNASKVRMQAVSIANQILKLRSGAAINEAEADRIMSELGVVPLPGEGGKFMGVVWKGTTNEENFIQGMKSARAQIAGIEHAIRNNYGAEKYDKVAGAPLAEVPQNDAVFASHKLDSMDSAQLTKVLNLKGASPYLKAEARKRLKALTNGVDVGGVGNMGLSGGN